MAEINAANVNDVLITHIVAIANALCGEDEETPTGCDMLRYSLGRIAAHLSGEGYSSLPAVTEDDNGKVLKVVNGAWTAASE